MSIAPKKTFIMGFNAKTKMWLLLTAVVSIVLVVSAVSYVREKNRGVDKAILHRMMLDIVYNNKEVNSVFGPDIRIYTLPGESPSGPLIDGDKYIIRLKGKGGVGRLMVNARMKDGIWYIERAVVYPDNKQELELSRVK